MLFANFPALCWSTGETDVVFCSCQSSFLVNSFCFVGNTQNKQESTVLREH